MNKITIEIYACAVKKLLPLAQGDTSGSRIAALVLLSSYNSYSFLLPIAELSCLDSANCAAALDVIRGRAELRIEPQELSENGPEIFENLAEQWRKCAKPAGRRNVVRY
jgi:hypothetical protein